jgi:glycosyltransferase involved in cell wall biosynthesis
MFEPSPSMRFSLIVATRGRTDLFGAFLDSLEAQTFRDFEVIISDQNESELLAPYLKNRLFPITHLRTYPGASHSRNAGIPYAVGEVVTFPDDDCTYPCDLLEKIDAYFSTNPQVNVLCTRSSADREGKSPSRFDRQSGDITRYNVWSRSVEFTIFAQRTWFDRVQFDRAMGPGAPTLWQCEEGPDLLLRMQKEGAVIRYDPSVWVVHYDGFRRFDPKSLKQAYPYACARGYLLRKHRYPWWFICYTCGRSLVGCLLQIARLNALGAKYYWAYFKGKAVWSSAFLSEREMRRGQVTPSPGTDWYKAPSLIKRIPS